MISWLNPAEKEFPWIAWTRIVRKSWATYRTEMFYFYELGNLEMPDIILGLKVEDEKRDFLKLRELLIFEQNKILHI